MVVQDNLCSNQSFLQCESPKAIPRIVKKKLRKHFYHKNIILLKPKTFQRNVFILYGKNGTLRALEYFGLLLYKKYYNFTVLGFFFPTI